MSFVVVVDVVEDVLFYFLDGHFILGFFFIPVRLRPMPMETRSSKVFFRIYCFKKTAENFHVPLLWGKKKNV